MRLVAGAVRVLDMFDCRSSCVHVLSLEGNWKAHDILTVAGVLEQIQTDKLTWVRAGGVEQRMMEELGEAFGLHPLAVEDVMYPRTRPKIEDYPDLTFIVVRIPRYDEELEWQQVGLFLGTDFLVTASAAPVKELDTLEQRILGRGLPEGRETSCQLLYMALDAIVDRWLPFMDELEEQIDGMEEDAADTPSPELLAEIRDMKRLISKVRKVSQPMREAFLSLERSDHPHIRETTKIYLRDVSDHMVRIAERLDHVKEMALIAQETWNATLANQQNQVMKRLTVIAALLLFPGLIAGLGGMNFEAGFPQLPYWWVTGGIFAFIVIGFAISAWRKWL